MTLATVLQTRLDHSQAAVKKFDAIADRAVDGRVHGTLQAWGASRTGRWAGRGLQLQNLKRPTVGDPDQAADILSTDPAAFRAFFTLEDLGSLVRSAITAPEGKRLVVADLASIESRVLGWLTKCRGINDAVAAGQDLYKVFASQWFGVPYAEVTKAQRTLAKPAVLGAGFGIGGVGLAKYAASMGVELDEQTAKGSVDTWRATYWEVPRAWRHFEELFRRALHTPNTPLGTAGQVCCKPPFLTWTLPSGRPLYYFEPAIGEENDLTYMGQNQYTNQWERVYTWGGKLVENLVQAIARDVLVEGLWRYYRAGGTIVGHVHDEIIAEENTEEAEQWLERLRGCMSSPIPWAPGLLLAASGYVAKRYRKD